MTEEEGMAVLHAERSGRLPASWGLTFLLLAVALIPLSALAVASVHTGAREAEARAAEAQENAALDAALRLATLEGRGATPERLEAAGLAGPGVSILTREGARVSADGRLADAPWLVSRIGPRSSGSFEESGSRIAWARIPGEDALVVVEAPVSGAGLLGTQPLLLLGVAFSALGLALLGAVLANRWIAQPLRAVARASERLAAGDWSERAPVAGTREVAVLGSEFNRMAEEIARHQEALAEANAHLDELVRARTEQLARAVEDLRAFNFTVAHELREPLRSLETLAGLVLAEAPPDMDPDAREVLTTIRRRAQRLQDILFDLLHYEDVGAPPPEFEEVDLTECFDEAAVALHDLASQRNGLLERPERLPTVRGHKAGLVQLFQELLENGLIYNESAEPRVVVRVTHEDEEHVSLAFEDNGIGIPEERREDVFNLFQRLHPMDAYAGGTGIGLAVARRIALLHDGQLTVDANPWGGSVFTLTLPRAGPKPKPPLPGPELARTF